MRLQIQSSDPELLERAIAAARHRAKEYRKLDPVGIAFLGAVVRGYFDADADIDIALFTRHDLGAQSPPLTETVNGFQIHTWTAEYDKELAHPWPMDKRWAYSECTIYHDPQGKILQLMELKVPMSAHERRDMLMSGAALSEWYINRLTAAWVKRGSLISAHGMFAEGLNHFFTMLFAVNERLVPADKWKIHYARMLPLIPGNFESLLGQVLTVREFSVEELHRRVAAFMGMWEEMLPCVEKLVGRTYLEFRDTV